MMRWPLALGMGAGLMALWSAALAEELPLRKAGLWEMKVTKVGSAMPDMTMQHCIDPTTDKEMSDSVSSPVKENCTKRDIRKTATGYVTDSVCSFAGVSMTTHADIVGDLNSAYTVSSTSHSDKGPGGKPLDVTAKVEAKWMGDCKPGQKPGDIVMPGGFKMNVKDAEKLKNLIPPQKK